MTPHTPYPQHPPTTAYPTAPPWAAPPASAPQQGVPAHDTISPYGAPYPQHGELLVPYPEEMVNAARPKPPAWWPVVAWTFFFGILGALSASRRAGRARRGRNSTAPYWVAWAVTLAASTVTGAAVAAVGVPAYLDYREDAVTKVVQEKLRTDVQGGAAAAKSVTCAPDGPRDAAGLRRYDCLLTTEDGRSGSFAVTADTDGNWTAVRGR